MGLSQARHSKLKQTKQTNTVSCETGSLIFLGLINQDRMAARPENPRKPPVSVSPEIFLRLLGLICVLETKLRSSCLQCKYFTTWALFQSSIWKCEVSGSGLCKYELSVSHIHHICVQACPRTLVFLQAFLVQYMENVTKSRLLFGKKN